MSEGWTVERVELVPPEQRDPDEDAMLGIPRDVVRGVVFSRMADGRLFVNETWYTTELLRDAGEAQLIEWTRESARPPED